MLGRNRRVNEMNVNVVGVVRVPVIDLKATGQNIKRIRQASGVSVRDLQMILGFTNPQAIYKWQNGDSMPSLDNLVILAAVLGVNIDDILVFVDGEEGEVTLDSSSVIGISVQL